MKINRKLRVNIGGENKEVLFGEIDSETELLDAYRLRFDVYSKKGYIDSQKYPNQMESDSYDQMSSCHHFIAQYEGKLIGYIRMIVDDPLPTEKYFKFDEPKEMSSVPREKRCELGRFIIIPPNREKGEYLPRGVAMLFLFDVLSSYALQNGITGGYSFIKKSLETKMKRLKIPVGNIEKYEQRYPQDGVLLNYFSQKDDPVVPIYFMTAEYYEYASKHIHNNWMFSDDGNDTYSVKNNIYTAFLKALKII